MVATDPEHAISYMTHAMLGFNEQLERMGELAVVLIIRPSALDAYNIYKCYAELIGNLLSEALFNCYLIL